MEHAVRGKRVGEARGKRGEIVENRSFAPRRHGTYRHVFLQHEAELARKEVCVTVLARSLAIHRGAHFSAASTSTRIALP